MQLKPVILCGGSGSRLWPLSRATYPKQLIAFAGDDSLLQETARRVQTLPDLAGMDFVCNEEYRFLVAEQVRAVSNTPCNILLEPVARNTAAAIAVSAFCSLADDPVLLVMPSDHMIIDEAAWRDAVAVAVREAEAGRVVTFGVPPTRPDTGYGYIKTKGDAVDNAYVIERFVEKPDEATARQYLESGEYLWNAGMFAVKASVFLGELRQFEPGIHAACEAASKAILTDLDFLRIPLDEFSKSPNVSVDYAVMERTQLGTTVPMEAGWTDVGSYDALWQVLPKDDDGNASHGDVLLVNSQDNLVHAHQRMVAGLGVSDLVIVETPDVVLVADKSRSQEVKQVVEALRDDQRVEIDSHQRVYRPWGFYDSIESSDRYQVKLIEVKPGASLSLQLHHHRAEHWVVVSGTARVTKDDEVFQLAENESTFIPIGTRHRLENPGKIPLRIIEVQSGSYLGEDDIVRFEDKYGRDDPKA